MYSRIRTNKRENAIAYQYALFVSCRVVTGARETPRERRKFLFGARRINPATKTRGKKGSREEGGAGDVHARRTLALISVTRVARPVVQRLPHRTVRNKDICRHFNLSDRNARPRRDGSGHFYFRRGLFSFLLRKRRARFALFAVNGPARETRDPVSAVAASFGPSLSILPLFFTAPWIYTRS